MNADRDAPGRWTETLGVEALTLAAWKVAAHDEGQDWSGDWIIHVVNSPAGCVIEFWFRLFFDVWAKERELWSALRSDHRAFLEMVLTEPLPGQLPALTEIAGRLHHLHDVDPKWCREVLLPLGQWESSPDTAPAFWWGMLSYGRLNPGLVDDGLLKMLLATGLHLAQFADRQRRRWTGMLASVALAADPGTPPDWVDSFSASMTPEHRIAWVASLTEQFRKLPIEAREQAWTVWIHDYWDRRNAADPVKITGDEASSLAECVPWLASEDVPDAVALLEDSTAGFTQHASWLRHIPEKFFSQPATILSRYFSTLMNHTAEPFYDAHYLAKILRKLVALGGDWTAVREAALRIKITFD